MDGLDAATVDHFQFSTSLGRMRAQWQDGRLADLRFVRRGFGETPATKAADDDVADWLPEACQRLIARLRAYADGVFDDFLDVALDLSGKTRFQQAVLHHCRRIRPGSTLTYGELAARAGYPGAARAVGQVMKTNCFPLIIPCHRVVAAGGKLGGYSAPDGLRLKRRLLQLELQAATGH